MLLQSGPKDLRVLRPQIVHRSASAVTDTHAGWMWIIGRGSQKVCSSVICDCVTHSRTELSVDSSGQKVM